MKKGVRKRGRARKRKVVKLRPLAAVAIATVIISAILLPVILRKDNAERGAKVPRKGDVYGIDISHNNQGPVIWDSLRVFTDRRGRTVRDLDQAYDIKPVSFVFIKATEGADMADEDFRTNWREAGRAPIRRGAYHFFRSSKDGELQAWNFIRTVGDLRHKDLPPVLDIETIHKGCDKKILNYRALQWLRLVEKRYGRRPIVYTYDTFARDYLSPEITGNYEIWIARYHRDSPSFEGWKLWQFTDRAIVHGVPGLVDLSIVAPGE